MPPSIVIIFVLIVVVVAVVIIRVAFVPMVGAISHGVTAQPQSERTYQNTGQKSPWHEKADRIDKTKYKNVIPRRATNKTKAPTAKITTKKAKRLPACGCRCRNLQNFDAGGFAPGIWSILTAKKKKRKRKDTSLHSEKSHGFVVFRHATNMRIFRITLLISHSDNPKSVNFSLDFHDMLSSCLSFLRLIRLLRLYRSHFCASDTLKHIWETTIRGAKTYHFLTDHFLELLIRATEDILYEEMNN